MKLGLFLLCLLCLEYHFVISGMIPNEVAFRIHDKCRREVGTSEREIENVRNGKFNYTNTNEMCYLKCTLKEIDLMADDGQMSPFRALKILPPYFIPRMLPLAAACGKIDDENPCVKATKLYECVYRAVPSVYMVP